MSQSFHFGKLQHFTTGTVGPSGQRVFYLQFGNPGELATLQLEKIQVSALAEFLDQLIGDVEPINPDDIPLALDLVEPVNVDWTVSSIGVAFEKDKSEFVVVAEELNDGDNDAAMAQIHLSPGQVKAFILKANEVVSAGRPPCIFCGEPLNHADGWCPCFN